MQKYFFQVVQDDVISDKIYHKVNDEYHQYGLWYSEAHYGKLAIQLTNYGLDQRYSRHEFDQCNPKLKDTIYRLSDAFSTIPDHSHFDMGAKIYLRVHSWECHTFGVVRMRDPDFFNKFDDFLKKNRWKLDEEQMKVINVLIQDGTYRLAHDKYDYVLSPTDVTEQFAEIVKEVIGF